MWDGDGHKTSTSIKEALPSFQAHCVGWRHLPLFQPHGQLEYYYPVPFPSPLRGMETCRAASEEGMVQVYSSKPTGWDGDYFTSNSNCTSPTSFVLSPLRGMETKWNINHKPIVFIVRSQPTVWDGDPLTRGQRRTQSPVPVPSPPCGMATNPADGF